MTDNFRRYVDGGYLERHPDWHAGDGPGKALDTLVGLQPVIEALDKSSISVVDIGCGTGAVLDSLATLLYDRYPTIDFTLVGYEPSTDASRLAAELHPTVDVRNARLEASWNICDVALLVDVLEHLENPWEMLRHVRDRSQFLVVRQPLIDSFGSFRNNTYKQQRERVGHIGYWNHRSFDDMLSACGWSPVAVELFAPWELNAPTAPRRSILHRTFVRLSRDLASIVLSGFYRLGAYERGV